MKTVRTESFYWDCSLCTVENDSSLFFFCYLSGQQPVRYYFESRVLVCYDICYHCSVTGKRLQYSVSARILRSLTNCTESYWAKSKFNCPGFTTKTLMYSCCTSTRQVWMFTAMDYGRKSFSFFWSSKVWITIFHKKSNRLLLFYCLLSVSSSWRLDVTYALTMFHILLYSTCGIVERLGSVCEWSNDGIVSSSHTQPEMPSY